VTCRDDFEVSASHTRLCLFLVSGPTFDRAHRPGLSSRRRAPHYWPSPQLTRRAVATLAPAVVPLADPAAAAPAVAALASALARRSWSGSRRRRTRCGRRRCTATQPSRAPATVGSSSSLAGEAAAPSATPFTRCGCPPRRRRIRLTPWLVPVVVHHLPRRAAGGRRRSSRRRRLCRPRRSSRKMWTTAEARLLPGTFSWSSTRSEVRLRPSFAFLFLHSTEETNYCFSFHSE
jgi:hypothetical protein